MSKEDLIELTKELAKIFSKYRIKKKLKCNVKTAYPMKDNQIIEKDMLHLKINDIHGFILEDSNFDVLEVE